MAKHLPNKIKKPSRKNERIRAQAPTTADTPLQHDKNAVRSFFEFSKEIPRDTMHQGHSPQNTHDKETTILIEELREVTKKVSSDDYWKAATTSIPLYTEDTTFAYQSRDLIPSDDISDETTTVKNVAAEASDLLTTISLNNVDKDTTGDMEETTLAFQGRGPIPTNETILAYRRRDFIPIDETQTQFETTDKNLPAEASIIPLNTAGKDAPTTPDMEATTLDHQWRGLIPSEETHLAYRWRDLIPVDETQTQFETTTEKTLPAEASKRLTTIPLNLVYVDKDTTPDLEETTIISQGRHVAPTEETNLDYQWKDLIPSDNIQDETTAKNLPAEALKHLTTISMNTVDKDTSPKMEETTFAFEGRSILIISDDNQNQIAEPEASKRLTTMLLNTLDKDTTEDMDQWKSIIPPEETTLANQWKDLLSSDDIQVETRTSTNSSSASDAASIILSNTQSPDQDTTPAQRNSFETTLQKPNVLDDVTSPTTKLPQQANKIRITQSEGQDYNSTPFEEVPEELERWRNATTSIDSVSSNWGENNGNNDGTSFSSASVLDQARDLQQSSPKERFKFSLLTTNEEDSEVDNTTDFSKGYPEELHKNNSKGNFKELVSYDKNTTNSTNDLPDYEGTNTEGEAKSTAPGSKTRDGRFMDLLRRSDVVIDYEEYGSYERRKREEEREDYLDVLSGYLAPHSHEEYELEDESEDESYYDVSELLGVAQSHHSKNFPLVQTPQPEY